MTSTLRAARPTLLALRSTLYALTAILALAATGALAQSAAWVTTDLPDYPPGSTVYITGGGFAPGEIVSCQVLHNPTGGDDATSTTHQPWTVTADADGNFSTTWGVPFDEDELNAALQLTATGQSSSLTAQTTFTDAGPSQLGITPTPVATYGSPFSVTVQSQNNGGNPTAVTADTTVTLTLTSGTGALGGTTTGTILNGQTSVTISGVTYNKAENNITIRASATGLTAGTATFNVAKKALTATGTLSVPSSKVYDGATSAAVSGAAALQPTETFGTGTASDGKPFTGDTVSLTGTASYAYNSKDVASATAVSESGLSLTGASSGNYTLTAPSLSATITAKALTMSGLSVPASKVYDGTTTTVVSGSPGSLQSAEAAGTGTTADGKPYTGDTVSITGTATGTYNSKDVTSATTVTFGGLSLTGAQATDYTLTIQSAASATITVKTLTLTGVSAVNRTYDATTTAALSGTLALQSAETGGNGLTSDGKPYTGDTVTLGGSTTATFASKDVANGISVTVTGNTLSGAQAGDYVLAASEVPGLTANIAAKTLTVTSLSTSDKIYDATTTATISGTAALQAAEAPGAGTTSDGKAYTGDTVIVGGTATGTFSSKDVGSRTVNVSGNTLGGAQAGNYALAANEQPGLTANISAKTITVTGLTANNKIYDATTAGTTSGSAALLTAEAPGTGSTGDGKPYTGDTVNVVGTAVGTFASKDVANGISVAVSGNTLTGGQSGNYVLAANEQSGLSANISAKTLTVTGLGVNGKIYDGTTAASLTGAAALQAAEAPGAGTTADGKPYTGDTVVLGGTAVGTFSSKNVGNNVSVTVTGNTLSGAQVADYVLAANEQSGLSANITAKALTYTGLSVSASKVYDATTAATPVSGTAALQSAEAAGTGTTSDGTPYSVDSVSLTGTPTGTYNSKDVTTATTVTFGGLSVTGTGSANYSITPSTQAATITPKALTESGLTANNKTYDGTATATFSGAAGLLSKENAGTGTTSDGKPYNGDTVTVTGTATGTFASKDVANGIAVSVSGLSLTPGGQSGDYSLTPFTLSANITPATLTYNAGTVTRAYGVPNPTFTGTVTGFVPGENQSSATTGTLTFSTTATTTSAPGGYAINGSGLTANNGNYTFAQAGGNATALTITKASTATALATSASEICSGSSVTFTATVTDTSPSSTGTPTGNAAFKDGGTTIGTVAVNGSGVATFTTSTLATGARSITAVYAGDSNFSTSTSSPPLTETVDQSVGGTASASPSALCNSGSSTITLSGSSGSIQWQSSSDNVNFNDITGQTGATLSTGTLTATNYFRARVTSGVCGAVNSTVATVGVSTPPVGGTATAAVTPVCSGSGTTITLSGYTGSIQWQARVGTAAFANISGATTDTLITPNLTVQTDFRAAVSNSPCAGAFSTTQTVAVVACTPASLGTDSDTSGAATLSTAATVLTGNTILVAVVADASTDTITVSDTAGNTYSKDADANNSGSGGVRTLIFSAPVTTALNAGTITVTFGATIPNDKAASFFSIADLLTSSPKDQSQTATGTTSGNENLSSGTTATVSQPDELLFGAFGIAVNGASLTQTSGFQNLAGASAGSVLTLQPAFRLVDAIPTGYADTASINNKNGKWAFDIVTYKRKVPAVVSINRANSNPTTASSVNFTVTFSESVTGVGTGDFTVAVTGLGGSPAVTGVAGSDGVYTVTVSTGTDSGTIGLNLVDDDSIKDNDGAPLGGTGTTGPQDGSFTGQVYSIDRSGPTITSCSPAQSASANAGCQASVPDFTGGVVANDPSGIASTTQSPTAGTLVGLGPTTVTITLTDTLGNSSQCQTSFTVDDTTAPSIACGSVAAQSANADATCNAIVPDVRSLVRAQSSDNCTAQASLVVTQSPLQGSTVNGSGSHPITVTVADASGNSTPCVVAFTVNDVTAPTIACGSVAVQSANADSSCNATVPDVRSLVRAQSSDNCTAQGSLTVTQSPLQGSSVSGSGSHPITVAVADAAGNSAPCVVAFTVNDVTAPTVSCGSVAAQTANADASCNATVLDVRSLVRAQSSDNCTAQASLTVTQSPTQGSTVSGSGSHPITVTVADAAGNSTPCMVAFTVNDITPPTITSCGPDQTASANGTCQAAVPWDPLESTCRHASLSIL